MTESTQNNADKFPYRDIGQRLEALRTTTGMSKKDFADLCGYNYTRYVNWASGHRRPLPDEAIVLCEKFGVTLDFIYRGIEAQLPHSLLIALSSNPRHKAINTSSDKPD